QNKVEWPREEAKVRKTFYSSSNLLSTSNRKETVLCKAVFSFSASCFFCSVSFFQKYFHDLFALIALNNDLAILRTSSCSTFCFQKFGKFFQIIVTANKSANKCHRFASALF